MSVSCANRLAAIVAACSVLSAAASAQTAQRGLFTSGTLSSSGSGALSALSGLMPARTTQPAQPAIERSELDALAYGGSLADSAAPPASPSPSYQMQPPLPPAGPSSRGLFTSGNVVPSGSGALAALNGAFARRPAAPQPVAPSRSDLDAYAYGARAAAPAPEPAVIAAAPVAPLPAAPAPRGLLTGSVSVGHSGGALAALGKGVRFPVASRRGAPVPVAYAPPQPIVTYDPNYRLDAGDKLRIVVYGQDGLTNTYTISASGTITMPLIGSVPARGQTMGALVASITAKLRDGFIREPSVAAEIESYRPFFILGEVAAPGQYPYVPNMSVESAVAIAGGFSPRARRDRVTVTHPAEGGLLRAVVPVGTPISPGDTIMVGERWF